MQKVLVANRGEIACRVLRSIHDAGYQSVAVYSDADADAPHVDLADQAIRLGPGPAASSYLNTEAVLDAAQRSGADAIHPGYGFLSENAAFASACAEAGLTFIGPSPKCIAVMGNKSAAKATMEAAGVPCIPGFIGDDQSTKTLAEAARGIGVPLMVKASAGGGGRGIRLVRDADEIEAALRSAASEAANAFGDGTLYLEKAIFGSRHIEVQIVADCHGNVLHLGERDCSAQRRNQKVVEEAPAPGLSETLRARICGCAVDAARAIGYVGAGTVEFLLAPEGDFYFLEMNTRLQVEHPVTELITGIDIVRLQLQAAAGTPFAVTQEDIAFQGHAIEARLYAEDPAEGFMPQVGSIGVWEPATGDGIRVDAGIERGQIVSSHYDSMIAKLVAWGITREEATLRLQRAIRGTVLLGLRHNGEYLGKIVSSDAFRAGRIATTSLTEMPDLPKREPPEPRAILAAAFLAGWNREWSLARWCGSGPARWQTRFRDPDVVVTLSRGLDGTLAGEWPDHRLDFALLRVTDDSLTFISEGVRETLRYFRKDDEIELHFRGRHLWFAILRPGSAQADAKANDTLRSPMSATVVDVYVSTGESVARGQKLLMLEAMKMEIEVTAEIDGEICELSISRGDQVSKGQLLAKLHEATWEE